MKYNHRRPCKMDSGEGAAQWVLTPSLSCPVGTVRAVPHLRKLLTQGRTSLFVFCRTYMNRSHFLCTHRLNEVVRRLRRCHRRHLTLRSKMKTHLEKAAAKSAHDQNLPLHTTKANDLTETPENVFRLKKPASAVSK